MITIAAAEVGVGPRDRAADLPQRAQRRSRRRRPVEGLTRRRARTRLARPAIPAVSFVLILFFGKRLPRKGAEIGIAALGVVVRALRASRSSSGSTGSRAPAAGTASGLARARAGASFGAEGGARRSRGHAGRAPLHVVAERRHQVRRRHPDRRPRGDDAVRRHADLAARARLLARVHARTTSATRTTTRCSACSPRRCCCSSSPTTRCSCSSAGRASASARSRSSATGGRRSANSDAALKAFLTTRTGDIGLMIGIIITFFAVGTLRHRRAATSYALSPGADHAAAPRRVRSCLFIGVIGKSGQFPLHTWLPDAMAGPTPVSALIHAATMVVAGVYLGARLYPVFFNGFSIGAGGVNFMALIGGITILIGAAARVRAGRHQEGARVLHDQPARLHGDGARRRRVDRGGVPPLHPRVLQGAASSSAPVR